MILCHRQELIDQIVSSLKRFGIEPGVIAAGYETNYAAPVQVASVFTLARRLESVPSPDLIIVDEAHHAVSKTTWGKILTHYNCLRLGVTATPYRLSGEGLNDLFDDMVLGPSVQELIDLGALSAVKTYAPAEPNTKGLRQTGGDFEKDALAELMDKPSVTGDAVTHYQRLCNGLPAIAFCVSIEHARHVAECFAAAGYRAASVDGKMDREQRKQAIKDFRDGKIQILASCELISEGFDVPGVVAGLLLRPTKSLSLHFQQVGRCLRPADGKERAIILDHAGNTRRFGLVTEPQEWTLASRERKPGRVKSGDESVSVRVCKSCFAATSSRGTVCPDCGTEFPIQQRKVAQRDGELHEVVAGQRRERKREQAGAFSYEDLVNIGRIRGYANPHAWAHHVMKARQKKKSVWSIR
jgi:superfamily II DNA or RNA helicase